MHLQTDHVEPIEKPAFISLAEAAAIAGQSYAWAYDRATSGRLELRRLSARGPLLVTVDSLVRLLAGSPAINPTHWGRRRPHLILIVDNDK